MNCTEALGAMRSILERTAAPDLRTGAQAHYAACAACGDIWNVAQETTCRDLANFLHDYLDGTLPEESREVFERHMALCIECEAYLQTYRTTVRLCGEAAAPDPCDGPIPDALIAAILAARAKEKRG